MVLVLVIKVKNLFQIILLIKQSKYLLIKRMNININSKEKNKKILNSLHMIREINNYNYKKINNKIAILVNQYKSLNHKIIFFKSYNYKINNKIEVCINKKSIFN